MTQIAIWNATTEVYQLVEAPDSYPYSLAPIYADEAAFVAGEWPGRFVWSAFSTSSVLALSPLNPATATDALALLSGLIYIDRPASYPYSATGIYADQAAWLAASFPGWTLITATIPSDIDTVPYEYDGTDFVPLDPVLNRLDSLIALLVSKSVITQAEADALPL